MNAQNKLRITEEQLRRWATLPRSDEEQKHMITFKQIELVLKAHFGARVEIFLQGSYANETNISQDSDIDVVVKYEDTFFYDISELSKAGQEEFHKRCSNASYLFTNFKNDVEAILRREFGSNRVIRKDKCIQIGKDSASVNADVVPCLPYRFAYQYDQWSQYQPFQFKEGIKLVTDQRKEIIGFPKQHIFNGKLKDEETLMNFKRMTRILKNMRNEIPEITETASFMIESSLWNIPSDYYIETSLSECLIYMLNCLNIISNDKPSLDLLMEVNNIKKLFTADAKWDVNDLRVFARKCIEYSGAPILESIK